MSQIQAFCFESTAVRILGTSENPLFVAKDVLEAIGSSTAVSAVREMVVEGLGKEFVNNQHLDTPGGTQEMLCLTEPALTLFVSRSRTQLGKRLNRWIHSLLQKTSSKLFELQQL